MHRILASLVAMTLVCAASAQVTLYEEDFDALTNGSLVGAPQAGWEGFALQQAGDPEIIGATDKALQVTVNADPNDNAIRQESRAVLTLPSTIDLTAWTAMTLEFELTLPAGASGTAGERHNFYWDFDDTPNRFGEQTINDGGNVAMIDALDGNQQVMNIATNPAVVVMTWEFDLVAGTVDTYYGGVQVDNDTPLDPTLFPGDEFSQFSFALVKDFRTAPFGYSGQIDNFTITAVPEPTGLGLVLLGGLVLLRRR